MEFKLRFDCNNAAFDDLPEYEIARILKSIGDHLLETGKPPEQHQNIVDVNGNIVGTFRLL